jgi:hypothetical protein
MAVASSPPVVTAPAQMRLAFSITLIAGGAHTVNVGTGAATSLATGDMLSIVIPVAGTVRAVKTLAADVISMPVS